MLNTELESGKYYRITLDDCCVQGVFVDRFVQYELDELDEPSVALFEHARIEPMWGSWKAEEVQ